MTGRVPWFAALREQATESQLIGVRTVIDGGLLLALLDIAEAVGKYVDLNDGWSAWNNQDGHGWPGIREALTVLSEAANSQSVPRP